MRLKLIISFLLISVCVFGQNAKLTVKVSALNVPLNNKIRVRFAVNVQGADDFKPPRFKDFVPVNNRPQMDTSSRVVSINGDYEISFQTGYTYIIKPKRKGTLIIEPASINYKGEVLKSEPVTIHVGDAVIDPNDPEYIADQNVNLVTFVSNNRPFVGEPIFVEYRAYFKDVGLAVVARENPKFEGFWVQDIPVNDVLKETTYKGEKWMYGVLKKVMVVPSKSGRLKVGKISLDLQVTKQQLRRDFFGNRRLTSVILCTKKFSSQNINITTQDFPAKNKPADFSGAVGDFSFTVTLDKNKLKANQSASLKVEVSGIGNFKSFKIPAIQAPKELEVYDPENKIKTDITSKGLKGYGRDTYTVVPVYKGKYLIPAVSFSYFNPKDKKYHTITSKDIAIDILEGKEIPKQIDHLNDRIAPNIDNTFKFIQLKSVFIDGKREILFGSILYYFLLLLPLFVLPLVVVVSKKRAYVNSDVKGLKLKKSSRLVKKHLRLAKKSIGQKDAFFDSLEQALHNFLKAKLSVETSDISVERIQQILEVKNVDDITIKGFLEVLKNCDFARYTQTTSVEMQVEFGKAKEILMQLDRQL